MLAPTVGALLARFAGPGVIQWGRPSWWIVAALIPATVSLAAYELGTVLGLATLDGSILTAALVAAPVNILMTSLLAMGEEIGWHGFLWPLLRRRQSFIISAAIMSAVWLGYHVPPILFGWYGSISGIPAFAVALVGFTLFLGVLTDRSRSVWPAIVAHGGWNALVLSGFAATDGAPAFAGSEVWIGEFGWLAAGSSMLVGVVATWWHVRTAPKTTGAS